ncbi:MAG: DsbA family protein [Citromicrobium sp.]|nr:MAG: DsbA family protein [Citromicrobium sp.]
MKNYLATGLLALACGFAGAAAWSFSGLGNGQTRDYLVANPDILPEMAEAFQRQQISDRLASVSDEVREPFPGAVLGNPQGSQTLVKFTDYGCTYCRMSVADTDRLLRENPDLRVVVREWPIFEGSEGAARMALAAAKQGKFADFYHAMFELGPPSDESVAAAARRAGLDLEQARRDATSQDITTELAQNQAYGQSLGFTGTPSWIAGDEVLEGAVGYDTLKAALAD